MAFWDTLCTFNLGHMSTGISFITLMNLIFRKRSFGEIDLCELWEFHGLLANLQMFISEKFVIFSDR